MSLGRPQEIEMDLQSVCRDVMDDVDGSLGCVLTDLETGLPLAAEYRAGTVMNGNMITLVSYVGIDLFRGKLVRNFERSLSRNHGSSEGFVREVQLTTSTTLPVHVRRTGLGPCDLHTCHDQERQPGDGTVGRSRCGQTAGRDIHAHSRSRRQSDVPTS